MKKDDKVKYLVVMEDTSNSIPVEWTKLSVEVFDNLSTSHIYNRDFLNDTGDIIQKTVIYLKPVKKFNKNVIEFEEEDCIIGISK